VSEIQQNTLAHSFAERLTIVRQRIEAGGGSLDEVTIVAVSKTLPASSARLALEQGVPNLGENYAQELVAKSAEVDDPDAAWHMIGNVQRNKVKKLASIVSLWQTVDRLSIGTEIAKRVPSAKVMIQVNTTGEATKAGCDPDEVAELAEGLRSLGLDLRGLMTIGPTSRSDDPRPAFSSLRILAAELGLNELSMGMSGDIEAAVSEGSTMIRVGTALFGARDRAN
jgi:pyridoxal phosphate enzyme (YggS family)